MKKLKNLCLLSCIQTFEQSSPVSIAFSYSGVLRDLRSELERVYGGFSDCDIQGEERNFQSIVEFLFLLFSINPELIKNIDFESESELDASQKLLQTIIDM